MNIVSCYSSLCLLVVAVRMKQVQVLAPDSVEVVVTVMMTVAS